LLKARDAYSQRNLNVNEQLRDWLRQSCKDYRFLGYDAV